MQGLLLPSIPRLSKNADRMRTLTLLDLLACVAGVGKAAEDPLRELVELSAPLLISRAAQAGADLQRRREDQRRELASGSSAVSGPAQDGAPAGRVELLAEAMRLEPEWPQWQGALGAFSAERGLATASDVRKVTEALESLRRLQAA